jgi:hypothetical protein
MGQANAGPTRRALSALCLCLDPSQLLTTWVGTRPSSPRERVLALRLSLLLWLSATGFVEAQTPARAHNAIYAEAFGNALTLGSLNYERSLTPSVTARVGFNPFGPTVPVMLNRLRSLSGSHWAEAGVGLLIGAGEDGFATATLGYRYQGPADGGVFRAALTPLLSRSGVAMWLGISLGVAF